MLAPRIIERVNGYYGYRAISRVSVTQIAAGQIAAGQIAAGMAEGSREFDRQGAPDRAGSGVSEAQAAEVGGVVEAVENPDLRAALDRLGRNICIKRRKPADAK
jgi:hypothetical protein